MTRFELEEFTEHVGWKSLASYLDLESMRSEEMLRRLDNDIESIRFAQGVLSLSDAIKRFPKACMEIINQEESNNEYDRNGGERD